MEGMEEEGEEEGEVSLEDTKTKINDKELTQ